jgi:hypothetical protein
LKHAGEPIVAAGSVSPPTRGRGLKPDIHHGIKEARMSPPTRGRGLKLKAE